jgi:hypothetical protein
MRIVSTQCGCLGWWSRDVTEGTGESSSNPGTSTVGKNIFSVLSFTGTMAKLTQKFGWKLNFYSRGWGRLLHNWDIEKWCFNIEIIPSLYWRSLAPCLPQRGHLVFWSSLIFISHSKLRMGQYLQWLIKSRDSVVGIATGYGLDDRGVEVGVQAPVGSRIFSPPCRPHRFCGPPKLLSNGYCEIHPES